ncbi:MAG TPA: NAD-dependent epimerase/dehydratase family protein [Dehalococcoidia bacterium]|nr:NAD-dependent epimerase/dehydratase family protein [Dehalococcoidia bacterium]
MQVKNKKCLVTGGAGFIGSHLTEELVSFGNEVSVIDDFSTGKHNLKLLTAAGVKIHESDITNISQIEPFFRDIDIIFHLAAMNRAQRGISDPLRCNEINVTGTLNCLKLAVDNSIDKFIFASSSSVYGSVTNNKLDEEMDLKPLNPYGVGKLSAEHYCRIFYEIFGLKTTILRYFSVYGPRQQGGIDHAGVIAKFINLSLAGRKLPIYGNGLQKRNFSYVKDVVDATILAAASDNLNGDVINIASEKEYSVLDVTNRIISETSSESEIDYQPPLAGDPSRNPANINKLKTVLNFSPKHPLNKGLKQTISSMLSRN